MKCKETLFDHPYPWTTQHLLRTIYNIVNEEKYKIYYNGEKLKQIEATKKTPYRSGVHQKSQMKVTILPRQQSKPQYQTRGKTYGTATDPKKTQRAESLHSKFAATWQGNRLHSKFTANANPHHGPGDVDWQKPSQHGATKSPHTPNENRIPMSQRVIHPTKRTPASSSFANFEDQQTSRMERSIFATLVIIHRATTDTTFSKRYVAPN